jgi:hypothetical protein
MLKQQTCEDPAGIRPRGQDSAAEITAATLLSNHSARNNRQRVVADSDLICWDAWISHPADILFPVVC